MTKALIVLAAMAPVAFAQTAPPCAPGTLASYIALGAAGCTLGTITFANFAYGAESTNGAAKISPTQIQVNPVFAIPATGSLTFSAAWGVLADQTQESLIKYSVLGAAAGSGQLTLQLGKVAIGAGTIDMVGETTNAGSLQVYRKCTWSCQSVTTATLPFTPTASGLQVSNLVYVTTVNYYTTLASFTASFNFCAPCS